MTSSFDQLHIQENIIHLLGGMGITEPTPIQEQAIPVIMDGRDVIALSQTGTGKTLAYLLPVLHKIDLRIKGIQAMVIVPTRELGMQILHEAEKLVDGSGVIVQSLIGGTAISRQLEKLRLHPQIVVGTPGRILELIRTRKLKMHHIKSITVDEVDQVFDLGSLKEVEDIIRSAPRDRQIIFLSATIPKAIQTMALRWMKEPINIQVQSAQRTSDTLEHLYIVCEERDKIDTLRRVVRHYNPKSAIVFINQINSVAELVAKLKYAHLSVEALYGEADKQERAAVLNGFREGKFQLLLATDVAARGLDIKGLTHVINFDPPTDADHYLHRAGRTGRMGKSGTAISIITSRETFIMHKFETFLGIQIASKSMVKGQIIDAQTKPSRPEKAVTAPKPVKKDRLADRKNKGAPKWLTNKKDQL
ncbi:MAG TPA: DEAD/DEAH box helicase [Bacilli bacterium]